MNEVTPEHIERAKRMIGCGLDVEEVSQWLANDDADKAEIKRLLEALSFMTNAVDPAQSDETSDWKLTDIRWRERVGEMHAALAKMSHRRCWGCGHEGYYLQPTLPWCLCEKCGGRDTRLIREAEAEVDDG